MVKIAVAGGTGEIAGEIIDVLVAMGKHQILIISRKDPSAPETRIGVTWAKADYASKSQLVNLLKGIDTVLCFSAAHADPGSVSQKLLIDACVEAGVRRFAPNEWGSASIEELPWYAEKGNVREYLEEINKEKKIIEYTLFQPGLLLSYLTPLPSAKTPHLKPMELWLDLSNRKAINLSPDNLNIKSEVTLTTVHDLANIVARAVEYEGEWPVIGGVKGETISMSALLEIVQKVRGDKPWDITSVELGAVRDNNFTTPWLPMFKNESMGKEQIESFSRVILRGSLLSALSGSWVVGGEWNNLFPDYKFEGVEEVLEEAWRGRE